MTFKYPDSFYKKQKELFDKKYIEMEHQRIHVTELKDRSVTPEIHKTMRMNSYAREDLPPKLTDEALIQNAEHYLSNCTRTRIPCSTYDEAIIHTIMPELIRRLKEKSEVEKSCLS